MADEEKADAIAIDMQLDQDQNGPVSNSASTSTSTSPSNCPMWKKMVELCIVIPGAILGGVLLYCLLTLATIVVASIVFLINTCIHLLKSMTGNLSHRKVVSPISDGWATVILVLAIAMSSVWLGIVRAVDSWEHRVLLGGGGGGLQVWQGIKIFMIVLGYYATRNGVQIAVNPCQASRPWVQCLVEAIYCLLLIPAVLLVMRVVPSWKHQTALGLLVWKWICAVILVILGQDAISLAMLAVKLVTHLWCHLKGCKGQKCVYYYTKGMRKTLAFVAVALMHLLTWCLYFRPHFHRSSSVVANKVSDFGTWTFVTELICAVLWLIKDFILLSWQAHMVYERPEKEIIYQKSDKDDEILMRKLTYWCCLYSLGLIDLRGGRPTEIKQQKSKRHQLQQSWLSFVWEHYKFKTAYDFFRAQILVTTQEENNKVEWQIKKHKWGKAITTLIELVHKGQHPISIHSKQKIARAFLLDDRSLPEDQHISKLYQKLCNSHNPDNAQKETSGEQSKESDDGQQIEILDKHCTEIGEDKLDEILREYTRMRFEMYAPGRTVVKGDKTFEREGSACKILKREVLSNGQESIRVQDFQALTEKAQQNCFQFQHFLASAQNVVKFLNRLMICFVIVLGIVMWLLLTEILPTKVIVVITSPVLAATFIFGDTIKTIFQGIVFAYFSHPFTIGHLCVIDKTQMEVKKIGIWRTTFTKLGTEEEVLYPNSDLATKAIINYGRNLQLLQDDHVEFSLKYRTNKRRIRDLKCSINKLVRQEKSNGSGSTHEENIDQNKNKNKKKPKTKTKKNRSERNPDDCVALQNENKNFSLRRSASLPDICSTREKVIKIGRSASLEESEMLKIHSNGSKQAISRNNEDINLGDVVVKQIQGNIKMTLNFKHDDSILDMTNAQAFNHILRKKSFILRKIADLICIQKT